MTDYRIGCGACPQSFDVDYDDMRMRCPSCGALHLPGESGWDTPTIESNPAGYPERDPQVEMQPAWAGGAP